MLKRITLWLSFALLFLLSAWSQANPNQIAILKWYPANTSAQFSVGRSPWGVAFDGSNVWVSNFSSDTVIKLRASDGSLLGTFKTGNGPTAMAFDGENLWVANSGSDSVSKIRGRDVRWSWENICRARLQMELPSTGRVFCCCKRPWQQYYARLRATDGKVLGTFPTGKAPACVAFDGSNVWVNNSLSASVTKLQGSDGTNLGEFPVGDGAEAIAFDGSNMWITNSDSNSVTKLRASDGSALGTFPGLPDSIGDRVFDGQSMWVTNYRSNTIMKLRISDGALLGTYPTGDEPLVPAFDGANIWVPNTDDNSVSKM